MPKVVKVGGFELFGVSQMPGNGPDEPAGDRSFTAATPNKLRSYSLAFTSIFVMSSCATPSTPPKPAVPPSDVAQTIKYMCSHNPAGTVTVTPKDKNSQPITIECKEVNGWDEPPEDAFDRR